MMDALFDGLGALFANGVGFLLLALLAGAIVVLAEWRLGLAGVVLIHLGSASLLVYNYGVAGVMAGGQMAAVLLCVAMLALAGSLQPFAVSLHQAPNLPLRGLALLFLLAAWWFLDPGYKLPVFSLLETELMIWVSLCALALWSFSASPLLGGIAVLLWSTPLYSMATVLLPGSGLAAVVGIADLFVVLACAYLILLEPAAQARPGGALPRFAPRLLRPSAVRPWGLARRPLPASEQPGSGGAMAGEGARAELLPPRPPSSPPAAPGSGAIGPSEDRGETVAL